MRVLMLGVGTPSTFLRRQVEALRAAHVDLVLATSGAGARWRRRLASLGVKALVPSEIRTAATTADVVHCQWPSDLLQWGRWLASTEVPIVMSARGRQVQILPHVPGRQRFRRNLERRLPLCAAYHCVSEAMAHELALLGGDPMRMRIVRTGVDTELFSPRATPPHGAELVVAMVGSLIWRKGYEYALRAVQRLRAQETRVRLEVVGGGDAEPYRRMADTLGIGDCVSFLGPKDESEVVVILQRADVFVQASLSEGIANSLVEAMACGLPVVATDVGGTNEAVSPGESGLLVPPRDDLALADAVRTLALDQGLRRRLGGGARQATVDRFDIGRWTREFVELYEEVM